jgi:DNA-binding beta-propeller fold protein YncE
VTVVFDAYPDPDDATFGRVPTVLAYGADLEPVGVPVVLSHPADRLHSEVAAVTPDGTVYLVADGPEGDRVVSVAPGAPAATPLLELPGHTYDRGLVVDPAGRWVLLPAAGGVRAVDVATRDAATVGLGCDPEQAPGTVVAGGQPGTVLVLGRCRQPRPGTATLWLLDVGRP